MKKTKGNVSTERGYSRSPQKLRLKQTLPVLARVRFESLQRGELDPFFMAEKSVPPAYGSVFLHVLKIVSIKPCLSSFKIFSPSEEVDL